MKKFTSEGLKNDPILRLKLYQSMLVDWEKPIEHTKFNYPYSGFCFYLKLVFNLHCFDMDTLPELFTQRILKIEGWYHYSNNGRSVIGRSQRVNALKNAIIEVEKLISITITQVLSNDMAVRCRTSDEAKRIINIFENRNKKTLIDVFSNDRTNHWLNCPVFYLSCHVMYFDTIDNDNRYNTYSTSLSITYNEPLIIWFSHVGIAGYSFNPNCKTAIESTLIKN